MNQFLPIPLYTFARIVGANGGISPGKLKNITPWLIKTILFEPIRWGELAFFNQRIRQHKWQQHPVFILGYYRSGTSYLHQCLTLDNRFGYQTNFQMVLPEVMLSTEKFLSPAFDLFCRLFNIKDSVHRVPLSFKYPGEEDTAMTTFLSTRGAHWGYFFPKIIAEQFNNYVYFKDASNEKKETWANDYKILLKKISLANKGKRLVLKSPPNTARIKLLHTIFPDARFIFIHRNPYQVYSSNKRLWQIIQKEFALKDLGQMDANSIILDAYSQTMECYLRDRTLIPSDQLVELAYDDFVNDPVASLRSVYETLQLGSFEDYEPVLSAFVHQQKNYTQLQHSLPPDEIKEVNEKLDALFRHWNYDKL